MFVIEKLKNTVPWTHVINDIHGLEIVGRFCKKELLKANQKKYIYIVEKVLKRKGNKIYVKGKGYDNSFNSWIAKKDVVIYNMQK